MPSYDSLLDKKDEITLKRCMYALQVSPTTVCTFMCLPLVCMCTCLHVCLCGFVSICSCSTINMVVQCPLTHDVISLLVYTCTVCMSCMVLVLQCMYCTCACMYVK